jgi:hypothetical protein
MSDANEASVQSVVHTPGPWEVREVDGLFAIAHRDGWVLDSNDEQQDRADAKLIAAAPDMFDVIKRFATVDWMGEAEINLWVKRCREIMRKVV